MSIILNKVPSFKLFSNLIKNSVVKQSCAGYVSEIEINQESKISAKVDFDLAIAYGEKVVGYPSTFSCIRWLLKDDVINFGYHIKKLAGTNHPLLATVKNLLYNGKYNMQNWELIVQLVAKCAGHVSTIPSAERDDKIGILHSQHCLSQITEMIRTAYLVHHGLINFQALAEVGKEFSPDDELMLGNKLSLLSGDYISGNASCQLAGLRNHDLNLLISSAMRDMAEYAFFGERDEQNNPLPFDPALRAKYRTKNDLTSSDVEASDEIDNEKPIMVKNFMESAEKEWTLRNTLRSASLLGKSCQGAMMLAGHPDSQHKLAYLFGKYLALAWQAWIELEPFKCTEIPHMAQFNLVSAPVLFHLDSDPKLYTEIKKGSETIENVDFKKIHKIVRAGPGVERTRSLQNKYSFLVLRALDEFPYSEARTALKNIVLSMDNKF